MRRRRNPHPTGRADLPGGVEGDGGGRGNSFPGVREPFRLFFPWAVVSGMLGTSLWILFYGGRLTFHPGQAHARLMIEGMGGGFALGFLATALPRMLGAPGFSTLATSVLLGLHAAAMGAHLGNHAALGDGLFAAALSVFALGAARKFRQRDDLPPPALVLAAIGFCGAMVAAWLLAFSPGFLSGSYTGQRLVRLLLYEGFLLLSALGVGAFLLPRILRLESRQTFPEHRSPNRTWLVAALGAAATGGVVVASLAVEAAGWIRLGNAIRLAAVVLWMHSTLPGLWSTRMTGTQAWATRLALGFILLSFALRAALPAVMNPAFALEHVLFVSGFGLLLFAVGARVVDGHSGHRDAAAGKSPALRWIVWLLLLTMSTRVSADYLPDIMVSHYLYAAGMWIMIAVIWLATRARKLATPDPEEGT